MAQQSPTKLLTRSRQSAHLRWKAYATKLLQNLGCCGKQLQVSELTRVPLVQLTVCGTEWGYGTLEELIKSSLPGVSLLPFYTHFSNCNCCVVDHVKSLRSGDKYLGLIESKYLAELLQIPISYYTPNNSGRYLACCVASWVDPFITGGSCNKWIILGILNNTMFNVRECYMLKSMSKESKVQGSRSHLRSR